MKRMVSVRWGFHAVLAGLVWFSGSLAGWGADGIVLDPAPKVLRPVLKRGDRLAICGDSITEQRMYSRIVETYLTVCQPELDLSIRQYGWSGERADGFYERMKNDVLRFQPTVATTCYGMNDHRYRPYEPWIGELYRMHLDAVVRGFEAEKVRVVVGSPGTVGKVPHWVKNAGPTVALLNQNLAELRNLALRVARKRREGFADIFGLMWEADRAATAKYGTNYAVPGKDGVHPGWAGQVIMAYAFLNALGVPGDLGTVTIDLERKKARATGGHEVTEVEGDLVTLRSHRYPFCVPPGDLADDNVLASGMQWVPFHERLNRFRLVVKTPAEGKYRITWGGQVKEFEAGVLRKGILLPVEFPVNPFSDAFRAVDEAVASKQEFETRQIKGEFHGDAGRTDMEGTVRRTETERESKVVAIKNAFQPVVHSIQVQAVQ